MRDRERFYKNSLRNDCRIEYARRDRYPNDKDWGTNKVIAKQRLNIGTRIPELYARYSKPVNDDFFRNKNIADFSVVIDERTGKQKLWLGPSSFLNHDCDANCNIESLGDGATLKAIRKILPG